jgi:hypothetical protein
MKLTVILRNDSPMIHCGDSPEYRSIQIDLTPEQCAAIDLRRTGSRAGVDEYESISKAFIEPNAEAETLESSELSMNERIDDSSPAPCSISLTQDEALVLKAAIQNWIERTGRKRMWPWRRLGWVDGLIYSRSVYVSARDKMDNALKSNN